MKFKDAFQTVWSLFNHWSIKIKIKNYKYDHPKRHFGSEESTCVCREVDCSFCNKATHLTEFMAEILFIWHSEKINK